MSDPDFEAQLDALQARLYENAREAQERSYKLAARPSARPLTVTFQDLRPGDYFTSAEGSDGRWVKCVTVVGPSCTVSHRQQRVKDGELSVLMEIPEPVTVSGETRYWIDRPFDEPVVVDANERAPVLVCADCEKTVDRLLRWVVFLGSVDVCGDCYERRVSAQLWARDARP